MVERERIPQNMTRNINSNANNNMHDNANVKYFNRNNSNNTAGGSGILNSATAAAAIAAISPMTTSSAIAGPSTAVEMAMNQEVAPHFFYQPPADEMQFHTNPINLGVNEFSNKSKTAPKGNANKKYSIPLRNRDCNSLEGAVGGENNNLRSAQQQDPKSTSKLFEALKENVYTEVTNLITANESRPHFLIQLFRELQLISSDPLRTKTLHSIQELYNRYVETTIMQEEEQQRANNNGSPVIQQQQPYDLPSAQSTPRVRHDAGFVNSIMNEIISAVHAVDYINDSILQKVTNIVFNHVSGASSSSSTASDIPSRLMISNDDFLRQLNHWNRTDKDEFITNLENYLNNILVECSNVAAQPVSSSSSVVTSSFNSTQPNTGVATIIESSSPNYNGFAIFMDGELAEADQVCSNDENMEEIGEGATAAIVPLQPIQVFETVNSEVLMEDNIAWDTSGSSAAGVKSMVGDDYQNNPNNGGNM